MQVLVSTDHNIEGSDHLIRHVETRVAAGLAHFAKELTKVEVHLSDEAAGRTGSTAKRCVIEAEATGAEPVAVTDHADTIEDALTGALHKLDRLLNHRLDRRDDRHGNRSASIRNQSTR